MKNLRKYGNAPFDVAVIHGGPGAPGEMAPVARELSSLRGVLEPLQTESTIEGQIGELRDVLAKNGNLPVALIGWSWGAWLSFVFAAQQPRFVKKLILIGSGPFEEKYALNIMRTRLSRLSIEEKAEVLSLMKALVDPTSGDKNTFLARFGKLISKADSYDPLPYKSEGLECQYDIYQSVGEQAQKLRSTGELLEFGKKILCPVVAIHGDYDPHPSEGVKRPLSYILKDFRVILLENCGHQPWIERSAKDSFYNILKGEIE
ncbi:MAG: alpha/beta fold hydrolase [Candidatus Aminicenantes bacterium]|nr:alpha/beta fold hydrolase [Candidatus Aminicenantes bacterium]